MIHKNNILQRNRQRKPRSNIAKCYPEEKVKTKRSNQRTEDEAFAPNSFQQEQQVVQQSKSTPLPIPPPNHISLPLRPGLDVNLLQKQQQQQLQDQLQQLLFLQLQQDMLLARMK